MSRDTKGMSSVELGDLSFVSSDTSQDGVYGLMEHHNLDEIKKKGTTDFGIEGLTSSILTKRGFGWLLEVEEEDDEASDKPLL